MFGVLFTCLASLDKMCAEKTRQDSLHKELLHLLPELRDGFFFYTTVKHASRVMWYSVVSRYKSLKDLKIQMQLPKQATQLSST